MTAILKDLFSGALPLSELPSFLLFVLKGGGNG